MDPVLHADATRRLAEHLRPVFHEPGRRERETDMIPLTFGGHTVAYHFVRKVA
jgi:hypothetical protein